VPEVVPFEPPARSVVLVQPMSKFAVALSVMFVFPPVPAVMAEIVTELLDGAALTPTKEPQLVLPIRVARFEASVGFELLLAKVPALEVPLIVQEDDVVDPAVKTSVFPRPVIVRVAPEVGSEEKVPVALAAVGALAVNVTPSMVSVEVPPMLVLADGLLSAA
jgi:hypothetical protein